MLSPLYLFIFLSLQYRQLGSTLARMAFLLSWLIYKRRLKNKKRILKNYEAFLIATLINVVCYRFTSALFDLIF